MNKLRSIGRALMLLLTLWLAAYSANLRAEDIDIYVDNSTTNAVPNVLFLIDNSANLGSTGLGCSAYGGTTQAPSLGTNTAGGMVQCALVDAINSLPDNALNIGILTGNANNFATDSRPSTDATLHEVCQGSNGGCLLRKLTKMATADGSKASLINFIKTWQNNNSPATSTTMPFTVTGAAADDMMQEAWAYFNGQTGLSGKTYSPSLLQGCQKNFIIYIGNTDKTPSNGSGGVTALTAAGANTTQSTKITKTVQFNPAICGAKNITSMPATSNNNDWSSNWADEWARLMFQQDGGTSTQEGMQNIATYTIGIIDNGSNQCTADYPALLASMADFGGGKAFRVSNASGLTDALLTALNEVQAVNSVFSSASLPVSVNAEGSYLNQIFLGMFRPDSSGSPRWMGNLKQYQLIRNSSGQLVMGDARNQPALSSGGTGFLSPGAVSFWTYKDTTTFPDSAGGFFVNNPLGTPLSGFDLADGEVVEKGGIAQQLRKANLSATFDGASGSTVNPRRVYTYCPQGPGSGTTSNCVADLTDVTNDFANSNTGIASSAFGSGLTVPVTSIVRTGTSALVTTRGNHGFSTGSSVTIKNALQTEYNVTQSVTVNSSSTFTITGLPDYPTTPSQGTYTVSRPSTSTATYSITALTRASTTSTATTTSAATANEVATVTTSGTHTFVVGDLVKISGMAPTEYNKDGWQVVAPVTSNTFTFNVPIYPSNPVASAGNYRVAYVPYSRSISGIATSGKGSSTVWTVTTTAAHGFHVGQTVTISGITGEPRYNASWPVKTVPSPTTFTIDPSALNPNPSATTSTGSVSPSSTAQTVATIVRTGSTAATFAYVTGMPASWFNNGDTVSITNASVPANETGYLASSVAITCVATDCSTFTYPITATPALSATAFGTVVASGGSASVLAGAITRLATDPTTAKVTGITGGLFVNGATVQILPSGTSLSTESAYVNTWVINCGTDTTCSSFTFGPVPLTPATPATGSNIQAYSGNTSPPKDVLIKWLRGQDNAGDEKGPGSPATVRPSVHGDVLHSRPLVINYGDARGVVVFYGSNDGVYRAVNGNQTSSITGTTASGTTTTSVTIPPGGELWGMILPDHYQLINRYRSNSPELKFPSSLLATAQPKDYFVDGPTGSYQVLNADGTIAKALVFLTMRRGGRFMYALDVTQPLRPKVAWTISYITPGFDELGQTWSRPRFTLLQNYMTTATTTTPASHIPVLIFGGGYDPAEDSEPPTADSMGRGIYVVNALTGALVWSASASCDATLYPCVKVTTMTNATPSDVTFVDRDLDGFTDKLYWGDLGGNVWRADISDASPANWKVNRLAKLGCDTGVCSSGITPRKFFFPPAILSIRISGDPSAYEAVSIVSGDREHPLRSTTTGSSYNVQDKFFMIKDTGTVVGAPTSSPPTVDVSAATSDLFNATSTLWDGTLKGFFVSLLGNPTTGDKGEKGVNAPTVANGMVFFATNRPVNKQVSTCAANLGEARAYAVSPFTGAGSTNVLQGGGMPPSAVTGIVNITETINGKTVTTQERFCIGCGVQTTSPGASGTIGSERSTSQNGGGGGGGGTDCTSGLGNCPGTGVVPKNLKRTYWYKQ